MMVLNKETDTEKERLHAVIVIFLIETVTRKYNAVYCISLVSLWSSEHFVLCPVPTMLNLIAFI